MRKYNKERIQCEIVQHKYVNWSGLKVNKTLFPNLPMLSAKVSTLRLMIEVNTVEM